MNRGRGVVYTLAYIFVLVWVLVSCSSVKPTPTTLPVIAVQVVQTESNSVPLVGGKPTYFITGETVTTWRDGASTTDNPLTGEWTHGTVLVDVGGTSTYVEFMAPLTLHISLVPIKYGGAVVAVSDGDVAAMRVALMDQLPFTTVNIEVKPVMEMATTTDEIALRGLVNELAYHSRRLGYGGLVYGLAPWIPDQEFVGWARGSYGIGMISMSINTSNLSTLVHEIGHMLGLGHAPCGDPDKIDPNYPNPGGKIPDVMYRASTNQLLTNRYDIMSYCGPKWMSAYNYLKIVDKVYP